MKERQCKDIDTDAILRFLSKHQGEWCTWFGPGFSNSVHEAFPPDTPQKLILAKMRMLVRSKLVSGCACGCRGDFEITDKGLGRIAEERTKETVLP